jgi:hypothetical protein
MLETILQHPFIQQKTSFSSSAADLWQYATNFLPLRSCDKLAGFVGRSI